jgi:hypothetical protein
MGPVDRIPVPAGGDVNPVVGAPAWIIDAALDVAVNLAHEQAAALVEAHGRRLADQRLGCHEIEDEPRRQRGTTGALGGQFRLGPIGGRSNLFGTRRQRTPTAQIYADDKGHFQPMGSVGSSVGGVGIHTLGSKQRAGSRTRVRFWHYH